MEYTELVAKLMTNLRFFYELDPAKSFVDFSHGELRALDCLARKENVLPTELSAYLFLSTARVANTLNALEKKGYISRVMSAQDRRKVFVNITPLGREYIEGKRTELYRHFNELLAAMGEKDANEFVRLIGRIVEINKQDGADNE